MLLNVKNALLASENAFLHTYLEEYNYYKTKNLNRNIKVKNETHFKNQVLKLTNKSCSLSKTRY